MSDLQLLTDLLHTSVRTVGATVLGQEEPIRILTTAFIIGGHILLEGPPGVGKTLLAKSFASTIGLKFNRIQFTPDLMPGDITGVTIFDRSTSGFRFVPGPLFADIVLADEVNRTPPKTQAALLEAMEERRITVDGVPRPLGEWFFVIATRNPIEHEGTFPLPEAQLDRFMFQAKMGYPLREIEEAMIEQRGRGWQSGEVERREEESLSVETLKRARRALSSVTLSPTLISYIMEIVLRTRQQPQVLLGASPRAALHLSLATRMVAAWHGRDYCIPDDVREVLVPTLSHRLIVRAESFGAIDSADQILAQILLEVPPPSEVRR